MASGRVSCRSSSSRRPVRRFGDICRGILDWGRDAWRVCQGDARWRRRCRSGAERAHPWWRSVCATRSPNSGISTCPVPVAPTARRHVPASNPRISATSTVAVGMDTERSRECVATPGKAASVCSAARHSAVHAWQRRENATPTCASRAVAPMGRRAATT